MGKKNVRVQSGRVLRAERRRLTSLLGVLVVVVTAMALMMPAISMTNGELVCGLEEHQHSDNCYEQVLTCGYDDESAAEAGHEHVDACYETRLVCEIPEHEHTADCYESDQDNGAAEQNAEEAQSEPASEAADQPEPADVADEGGSEGENENQDAGQPEAADTVEEGNVEDEGTEAGADADADIAYPATSLEQTADLGDGTTLEVRLDADEGVLPEGASMQIAGLQKKKAEKTLALMRSEAEKSEIPADASQVIPFDIQLLDAEGNLVEPAGDVRVTVKSPAIGSEFRFALVHVKYAENSKHKDQAEVVELTSADPEGSTLEFMASEFSPHPYGLVYVPASEGDEAVESDASAPEEGEDASESTDSETGDDTSTLVVSGDNEESADAEGESAKNDAADMPAKTFKSEVEAADGSSVTVSVQAPEGALPAGTTMKVEPVAADDVLDAAKAEAADRADMPEGSVRALAVDITFEDADGNEIEPAKEVRVAMVAKEAVKQAKDDQIAVVHVDGETNAELVEDSKVAAAKSTVYFDASDFSVYALVYTVDFHWEVDGKTYDFSLPGGGFISLTQLVEALNIADDPEEFTAHVRSVEFSNPELVWVGKPETETTVGKLKEANGLDCRYSAELTEQQIAEINEQTVQAGDWALIGLQAFETEESLNVTMENGDQWSVKVTDAAVTDLSVINNNPDKEYILYTRVGDNIYVLKTDGDTVTFPASQGVESTLNTMDYNYKWKISYVYTESGTGRPYYMFRPCNDNSKTLYLSWDTTFNWQTPNNHPLVVSNDPSNLFLVRSGNGFKFEGYNGTKLVLENGWFAGRRGSNYNDIIIYEQGQLDSYQFTVTTDDYAMGKVVGMDKDGANQSTAEYDTVTNSNKQNQYQISAQPQSNKYLFDYWDLNGTRLPNGETINANTLPIPYQGSTLTAHFKRNPNWKPSEDEKEGRIIDKESLAKWLEAFKAKQVPLDDEATKKTAEVYDYENRIYRVDLTSKSNLETFNGIVDLGFILDVSGSMKFPSRLKPIEGLSDVDVWRLNEEATGHDDGWWHVTDSYYWQEIGLDTSKTYYLIAEKSTRATVYRIFYEGGVWKRVDASYYPGESTYSGNVKTIGENGANFGQDAYGTHYPFYEDDDYPNQRRKYEQDSLGSTINELNSIINSLSLAANETNSPNVKVAWNTFCATVNHSDHVFRSVKSKDDINIVYDYSGGTRTDSALQDARSFQWENSATKYAILITDGAPQLGSGQSGTQEGLLEDVRTQAKALRDQGITLITIGLSMKDVKVGSVLLYDIASKDADGDPYFYSAESGDELQYILYEIIQKIVKPATVQGDVTDTVNEAFYPIDLNTGAPLENGQMINLEGKVTTDTSKPYGTVIRTGSPSTGYTYQIKWSNQVFGYDEGWHGTVYVKAKEDFIGGNAVRTNAAAEIQANSYKVQGMNDFAPFNAETKAKGHKTPETPRVNVNELHYNHNQSEWTVYLGTEVNPKEELKRLYNRITVDEVVTAGSDTDGNNRTDMVNGDKNQYSFSFEESILDQRPTIDGGQHITFPLKDIINLTDADWDAIITQAGYDDDDDDETVNEGINKVYDAYGQDCPGSFNFKLVKDHDPEAHVTDQVGKPAETYTLHVLFTPDYEHVLQGQGGTDPKEYHIGDYGTAYPGHAAGTEDSVNVHKVNVYAKPLDVIKKDAQGQPITDGTATFRLLRPWTEADAQDSDSQGRKVTLAAADGYALDGNAMTGDYYLVEEKSTESGVAHFSTGTDETKLLDASKDPYYLIEWAAPQGYKKDLAAKAITVEPGDNLYSSLDNVETPDVNESAPLTEEQVNAATNPPAYNWNQGVRLKVNDVEAAYYDAEGAQTNTGSRTYVISTDTEGAFQTDVLNEVAEKGVKLVKVGVDNTDSGAEQTNLAGATFTIYHATGDEHNTKGDVVVLGFGQDEQRLENLVSQEATGLIWQGKLPAGYYLVEETAAPAGYNKLPVMIRLAVTKDGVTATVVGTTGNPTAHYEVIEPEGSGEDVVYGFKIIDVAGIELPSTGGPGTTALYLFGGILVLAAGFLLWRRRSLN